MVRFLLTSEGRAIDLFVHPAARRTSFDARLDRGPTRIQNLAEKAERDRAEWRRS